MCVCVLTVKFLDVFFHIQTAAVVYWLMRYGSNSVDLDIMPPP